MEHPTNVTPEESFIGIMGIGMIVGVFMVHTVQSHPVNHAPLGRKGPAKDEEIL